MLVVAAAAVGVVVVPQGVLGGPWPWELAELWHRNRPRATRRHPGPGALNTLATTPQGTPLGALLHSTSYPPRLQAPRPNGLAGDGAWWEWERATRQSLVGRLQASAKLGALAASVGAALAGGTVVVAMALWWLAGHAAAGAHH